MNKVIEGLSIIAKYDPDSHFAAAHDQIWFGSYLDTKEQMTEDEIKRMDELGWSEDEDSWHRYT